MWGQNWGQMIWGHASAVPALGFWGAILLAASLGALGARRLRGARPRLMGALALALAILLPISARALPFVFSNGTVADATQVNANFQALASQQGLTPSASSALVDLGIGGGCTSGSVVNSRVLPDGSQTAFAIAPGQTLVLTDVIVAIFSGSAAAGHTASLRLGRTAVDATGAGMGLGTLVDSATLTLDARGTGTIRLSYGAGSAYGPGTGLCVFAQDNTAGGVLPPFASAHGFVTTQ
jgi:hypothetical protein